MFTQKNPKKLADLPPTLRHIYLHLKRCNYVIRKLLSKLNPNVVDIEACENGCKLRKVVIYPAKN